MKNSFFFIFIFFCLISCKEETAIVNELRCENIVNPEGINTVIPRFSWKSFSNISGVSQSSYQILVASDPKLLHEDKTDLWNSGKIDSESCVLVPYQGMQLSSRSLGYWKVCVWDDSGKKHWSKIASFSVGLLEKQDWTVSYIALPVEAGNPESPLLRKSFKWEKAKAAKLHVNSLGYHEVWLNGKKVTDAVLTPAVSQLDKRSLINTYDLLPYLQKGENELVLWLGQGWYRPWLPGGQHEGPVVRAQMDILTADGSWNTFLGTDNSWVGRSSGYSSIGKWRRIGFGGEKVDASELPADLSQASLNAVSWHPVIVIDVPEHEATPQMSEYNRITDSIKAVSVTRHTDSTFLVDMGKNITGYAEVKFAGLQKGQEILMQYYDNDAFANTRQSDRYIAVGNPEEIFRNRFNYHGFRYIEIFNLQNSPKIDDITAYFIQEDFKTASSFACSDADMNAIHDMIQYTLRCLSLGGYIVDCPHMERLGYGGDGNASTVTAQIMFDLSPLYSNWFQAWEDCMQEDGGMPHTAPNPYRSGGGPYWCGFIVLAPWNTYVNYGDIRTLEQYYPVMQKWFEYVEFYSPNGLLQTWPNNEYRNWFLGDWATPEGIDQKDEASVALVTNCAMIQCYEMMEKIARVLGKSQDVAFYAGKKENLRKLVHQTFFDTEKHVYASASQIDITYPMLVGATPDSLTGKVSQSLFREINEKRNGHMASGLVGVPVITEWITKTGYSDLMYSMLKKRDYPGYLYMIDHGATTTWEHWNGQRSHIHNCYNGIGSWFYQAIGGILPDENHPAYQQFFIKPQTPEGITWANVTKDTPYGNIVVNWTLDGQLFQADINVPYGTTATFVLPEGVHEYTLDGENCQIKDRESQLLLKGGRRLISYLLSNKKQ